MVELLFRGKMDARELPLKRGRAVAFVLASRVLTILSCNSKKEVSFGQHYYQCMQGCCRDSCVGHVRLWGD